MAMDGFAFMKMYLFKLHIVLFLLFFHEHHCQRRLTEGEPVTNDKRYVVYLLKAEGVSPRNYMSWLCGGAIVSSQYIVTSAACVTDVVHLYAIAGFRDYVNELQIDENDCTKEKKKKIIFTCTPKDYDFEFQKPEKWSYIDIAMVQVESPYDFNDQSWTACHYTPSIIPINYEAKYQEPGIDAIVLGWGHPTNYREDMDTDSYNEKVLHFAPVLIENKEECKKEYAVYEGMDKVIDEYMICTAKKGNLNDEGATILKSLPTAQGCLIKSERRGLHSNLPECDKNGAPVHQVVKHTRKNLQPSNLTTNEAEQKSNYLNNSRRSNTRRAGICQNDHGGPLVTWVGAHEVLIGIASVFKVSESLECIGPYLYTSTQCNGAFMDCILQTDTTKTDQLRRSICKNFFNATGYHLAETYISWKDHPDGPADNERNITTHASVTNTTNNETLNVNNSKEEGNKTYQVQNTTILVNNTNYTAPTLTIEIPTLTRTTKAVNIDDSTPINLTNMNITKNTKPATEMLTTDTSVALKNETFANETGIEKPTNYSTKHYSTTTSKNYVIKDIDGKITTVLMRSKIDLNSTTVTNIRSDTTVKPGNTTTKKVNVTTTVDVRTTKTTHVYLRSTTANTGDLEHAKPRKNIILSIN